MVSTDPTRLTQVFTTRTETHEYELHWTSLGPDDAPPLVFVHGTPWSSRVWAPYALALSSKFKVYLCDNPGFGESPIGRRLTPSDSEEARRADIDGPLAGAAKAFAQLYHDCWNFHERPPHVIAHDHGGLLSLRANLLHGCQYASLCLIDVVAIRPFGSPFFRLVAENRKAFESIPGSIFNGIVRAYIDGARHKPLPPGIEEMLAQPWREDGSQGPAVFIRQLLQADQRHAEDIEERYGEVGLATPVKVIWGKNDTWLSVDRAERLGRMVGAKEVVTIDEAGHLIMYDQPERLATEIALWLGQASGAMFEKSSTRGGVRSSEDI